MCPMGRKDVEDPKARAQRNSFNVRGRTAPISHLSTASVSEKSALAILPDMYPKKSSRSSGIASSLFTKDWEGLTLSDGKSKRDAREYLRTVSYKDAIPDFKTKLAEIGKEQEWGLEDIRAKFSNDL